MRSDSGVPRRNVGGRKIILLIALAVLICTGWSCSQPPVESVKPVETVKPVSAEELKTKIEALIKQLGDDDWYIRKAAQEELIKIGAPAIPFLKVVLNSEDPEIGWRAKTALVIIERNIRFANLKISPALKNKIEALLGEYPDKFLFVSRVMIQQENGSFKPLQGVKVDVTIVNSQMLKQPLPPDSVRGEALEPSDEDGILVILLDEEKYTYYVQGTGIMHTPETEGKTSRWYPPEEIKAKAGDFIIIPDVEFVKEIEIISPKEGEKVSLKSNSVFKWKPYPEALYYRVRLGIEEKKGPGWTSHINLVDCKITDGKTSITWNELFKNMHKYQMKKVKIPGEYTWDIQAYDKKDRSLSAKYNNHFHLTE